MEVQEHLNDKQETSENCNTEEFDKSERQHSELLGSESNEMSALFEGESCRQDTLVPKVEEKLDLLSEQMKDLVDKVDSLQQSSDRTHSLQQVISDLGNECCSLRELHHEREVTIPLACLVIGVADRCRKQIKELGEMAKQNETANNKSALKALHYVIRSRKADLTEIEGVIASMGIELYESPENTFKPELHTCLQRVKSDRPEQHLQIAARILPGYRRYERVVRKEIVNLYVNHNQSD